MTANLPNLSQDAIEDLMTMAAASTTDGFGGEAFLSHVPPNYQAERIHLGIALIASVLVWFVAFPFLAKSSFHQRQRPALANKPFQKSLLGFLEIMIDLASVLLFMTSVGTILLQSSNNSYSARGVFEAPLLTSDECRQILAYSYEAAQHNVQNANNWTSPQLLKEPLGWQKSRHASYPTTDLNLMTDPFSQEARVFLGSILDARLATLIARIYGVSPHSIRAYDVRMPTTICTVL